MAKFRIPLAGSYNTRITDSAALSSASGIVGLGIVGIMVVGAPVQSTDKDQRYINCYTETVVNPYTQTRTLYCVKRAGFASDSTPSAGNIATAINMWTGNESKKITAFGGTNSTIYDSLTSLGAITGKATAITETVVSNAAILAISSTDNTGWATSALAVSGAVTFTADTHTNTTLDNISSTVGLVVGQLLTGTGFAANTRIQSIDSATSATLTVATTATNAGVTVTRTILGKIVDVDFPGNAGLTLAGTFAHMDGYAFIMDTTGGIWNADLNSVTGWTATSVIYANSYPDIGRGCVRHRDKIMAFGTESTQFFQNSGYPSGSPLSRIETMTMRIGCVNSDAITQCEDGTYWVGSSPQGGLSVHSYTSGYKPISTPEIDAILLLAGAANISLTSFKRNGRNFIVVNASSITFVCCIEENYAWHEMSGPVRLWYKCAGVSTGSSQPVYAISNVSTSGKIFIINPSALTYQDNGLEYTARIQLSKLGDGDSMTFWEEVNVIGDQTTTSSTLTISYTDDDYNSYDILGDVDLADQVRRIAACGAAYRRAWVLTHSDNIGFRLEALSGRKSVGTS